MYYPYSKKERKTFKKQQKLDDGYHGEKISRRKYSDLYRKYLSDFFKKNTWRLYGLTPDEFLNEFLKHIRLNNEIKNADRLSKWINANRISQKAFVIKLFPSIFDKNKVY